MHSGEEFRMLRVHLYFYNVFLASSRQIMCNHTYLISSSVSRFAHSCALCVVNELRKTCMVCGTVLLYLWHLIDYSINKKRDLFLAVTLNAELLKGDLNWHFSGWNMA